MIPLPFGTISIRAADTIEAPAGQRGRARLEALRRRIEDALHDLHGDAFREAGRDPVPRLSRLETIDRSGWDQGGRADTVQASRRGLQ